MSSGRASLAAWQVRPAGNLRGAGGGHGFRTNVGRGAFAPCGSGVTSLASHLESKDLEECVHALSRADAARWGSYLQPWACCSLDFQSCGTDMDLATCLCPPGNKTEDFGLMPVRLLALKVQLLFRVAKCRNVRQL